MKKIKLLVLTLMLIFSFTLSASADQVNAYENDKHVKSVVFAIDMDEYFINGEKPGIKMDAKAFIENDRTYVPVRYLGYALGLTEKDIDWDGAKQKATLKGKSVLEMTIGKKEIVTNGVAKGIDVAPLLKSEPSWRTYLPARFVAEGLGYKVDWEPKTQTVICWPGDSQKPDVSEVQNYVKEQKDMPEMVRDLEAILGEMVQKSDREWIYKKNGILCSYDLPNERHPGFISLSSNLEVVKEQEINKIKKVYRMLLPDRADEMAAEYDFRRDWILENKMPKNKGVEPKDFTSVNGLSARMYGWAYGRNCNEVNAQFYFPDR